MRLFILNLMILLFSLTSLPSIAIDQEPVLSSLVKTTSCDDQKECLYTYTLATYIGRAIVQAESIIGPRDKDYTILGYEFTDNPAPQIWFPGNRKHVVIQLTRQAMLEKKRALYQLGHEVFHTLSPIVGNGNALEEGLATEFSLDFVKNLNIKITPDYINSKNYTSAYYLIGCLRNFEPKLNSKLQQLRSDGHQIGNSSSKVLLGYLRNTPVKLLRILAKKLPEFDKQDHQKISSCLTN
ncbi:MAG: hypothetical protein AB8D52_06645 [Gammaproteobacteria bacterium]